MYGCHFANKIMYVFFKPMEATVSNEASTVLYPCIYILEVNQQLVHTKLV